MHPTAALQDVVGIISFFLSFFLSVCFCERSNFGAERSKSCSPADCGETTLNKMHWENLYILFICFLEKHILQMVSKI